MRRERATRGRRVLLWAVGVFFAVQVAGSVALDYRWPDVRFPFFHYQTTRVDHFPAAPTILLFGSSRFGSMLEEEEVTNVVRGLTGDPAVLCYNAAVPAGDLIVSERLLGQLLARGVRPRYALIELCPEVVNHRNDWMKFHVGRQLRWDDLPTYCTELTITGNLLRLAGTRLLPLWTFRDEIRTKLGKEVQAWAEPPAEVSPTTPGVPWWPKAIPSKVSPSPAVDWARVIADSVREVAPDPTVNTVAGLDGVARTLRRYRPGGNAAAALERMMALCRAHGVEPILVGVPLSSGHRGLYTPAIEAAFQAYVAELTGTHGCRFIDYRARVPDAFFIDHHHGSPAGKLLFSRVLSVEVLAPTWTTGQVRGD